MFPGQQVFEPLLQPMVTPETLPMHPVRELQERCQQQAEGLEYKATRAGNVATVEVYVDGVQIGSAQNAQKKMAQKLAARNALVILKEKEVIKEQAAKDAAIEAGDANNGKAKKNGNAPFTRQALNDICLKRQWPMPQYKYIFFPVWILLCSILLSMIRWVQDQMYVFGFLCQ